MDFMINIDLRKPPRLISYSDGVLLMGSCFTEHIGDALEELKFPVLQNPNGILFDPVSVSRSLVSYIENRQYNEKDFFQLDGIWHSWDHHSRFSHTRVAEAVHVVNKSQKTAHEFLKKVRHIIITLGSSYSYRLTDHAANTERFPPAASLSDKGVANCHRAPQQWFQKHLLNTDEIIQALKDSLEKLFVFNPELQVILTVSPVRHIRDGVVDNNRSKARLLESVHYIADQYKNVFYFPAYELVIDVLRDYRFYDIDLVHPNYMATEFVLQKFIDSCVAGEARKLMIEVKDIITAKKHKILQPGTEAHRQFFRTYFQKVRTLQERYPFLSLKGEQDYFASTETL